MSQYRRPSASIYASRPARPARWPWALLLVVLIAIGAIGALIIRGAGNGDDGPPGPTVIAGQNGAMIVVSPDGATQPPSASASGSGSDAASGAPSGSAAAGSDDSGGTTSDSPPSGSASGDASAGSAGPPTNTPVPPIATPNGPSNIELAQQWGKAWQSSDYQAMYGMLSDTAKGAISQKDFIDRYQAIAQRMAATQMGVTVTTSGIGADTDKVPFTVNVTSGTVGQFSMDNTLPLVRQNGLWKVVWTPSVIIDGLGTDGCVDLDTQPPERGQILDRNGNVLAADEMIANIAVVPGNITDRDSLDSQLADLLDMSPDDVAAAYANAGADWVVTVKSLPEDQAKPLLDQLGQIPGVVVQPATGRIYPYGAAAAHITGYVTQVTDDDIKQNPALTNGMWVGRSGLESGANDLLAGTPGATLSVVDCASRTVRSTITDRPTIPGQNLILTLDIGLQQTVDKVLNDVQGAERGSAVILDPRTGAVLAMASHPNFDPNGFVLGFSSQERQRLNDKTLAPMFDRAAEGTYPVGSIFKVITMAGGMKYLGYTNDTPLSCPSSYELNGNVYNDWVIEWGDQPQGQLSLHDALVQSCDTVFYDIGAKLDDQDSMELPDMARAFGLGAPTNIPYLQETGGVVPDPDWKQKTLSDGWSTGDAINLSIGQGFLLATPLQMANVYATIANGGTLLQPFIVSYTQAPNGAATPVGKRTERGTLPIDASQVSQIQQALRDQTSNTTDRGSARVFGAGYPFAIAGKTGTSETSQASTSKPHSWFAAFGPWTDASSVPTIASVVMIENIGEGGKFAAPATKDIYDWYAKSKLADAPDNPDPPSVAIMPSGSPPTATSGSGPDSGADPSPSGSGAPSDADLPSGSDSSQAPVG